MRVPLLIALVVVVAGLVWVLAFETMLGALLIIGGVMGLFVMVLPDLIDRIAVFLSTGNLRRR
ncbi:MAG: hypothetical protein QOE13_1923 [Gaiellaceae bacterium]|jgi:hypothetical protein|nr:hypothetical protein [Gaiellaceae bacterium]